MLVRLKWILPAATLLSACGGPDSPPVTNNLPPPFPTIQSFEVDRAAVRPGETVQVSWRVADAARIEIAPGLLPVTDQLSGTVTSPPLQDTVTYTLFASSDVGETQRAVTVTVVTGKAEILSFGADPALIEPGQSSTLRWQTSGALAVKVEAVGGAVLYEGQDGAGEVDVQPATSTTYRLTIEGDDTGPKTQDAQVLVGAQPRVISFVPDAAQITEGSSTTLRWQVEAAEQVEIRDQDDNMVLTAGPNQGTQSVSPLATSTYTLIATSAVGTAQQSTTVTVLPPGSPRITRFEVTPANLVAPGAVTVTWETADADIVDLEADGESVPTFPRTPSGTLSVDVASDTTFTLVAENDQERTTQMVRVTVGTPDTTPPEIMHAPAPGLRTEGTAEQITATITDAESNVASATLFYRVAGQGSFQSLVLMDSGNDRFQAEIPGPAVTSPAVEYYIQATDDAPSPNGPNGASSPMGAPANVHRITVQPDDSAAPTVNVTPVPPDQAEDAAVTVRADVSDSSGVARVTLYYKRSTDTLYTAALMSGSGAAYAASIPAQAVLPPGVDYYVEAEDVIVPPNVGRAPQNAPTEVLSFSVVAIDRTAPVITHTPVANGQAEGMPVTVNADVADDSGVQSVTLFYKARSAGTYSSVAMTGAGATRTAQIPLSAVLQPAVDYYIEATDQATPSTNTGRSPSTAPGTAHGFTVSPVDNAPPTILHTPIDDGPVPGTPLTVQADVVDGSGVRQVTLHYRTEGTSSFGSLPMTAAGPTYSVQIPGNQISAPGLEYYFEAVDLAPMMNAAVLPAGAPASPYRFATGVGELEPNDALAQATPFLDGTTTKAIGIGAILPALDVDLWIIDVPAGAARYTVDLEVTVGGAGICNQADPELFLLAADGSTVLEVDDTDGVGSCPSIDPSVDRGARALAPGRYYVRVEEDGRNRTIGQYELRGRMDPVQCGNSILESAAGELCDDGNTVSGDGCSSTCQFEPVATFTAPGGTATDSIQGGNQDLYGIVIGQGQFLTAFTSGAGGTGCPGDTVIELYDTDGVTRLVTDDDGGTSNCSNINPGADAAARNMTAGTYWLRVRGFGASTSIPSYQINVQIADNVCGNNSIEGPEQCDDGNANSGDGCSSTCQWETAGVATGTGGSFTGGIAAGNVDWYQVEVPTGMSIRAESFVATNGSCTADTVLRLYAADRATELVSDDDGGLNRCSLIDPLDDLPARALTAGTYFVTVEEYGNNSAISSYTLDIQIVGPTCGDGWVGGTEQCDDGNTAANDGCSATCAWEGAGELEPNDQRADATTLLTSGNQTGTALGTLGTTGDEDWYQVVVPAGGALLAEVTDVNGACPVNTALSLRSVTGTELASDTRDGPGECPRLSPGGDTLLRNLSGGTYYLQVTGSTSNATYQVRVQVFTPGCGDLYLTTGEQCDDGNTMSGDGCSATCQFEITEMEPNDTSSAATSLAAMTQTVSGNITPGDTDWYSLTVPANTRLAVYSHDGALDQCPTVDTRVTIYDDTGTNLLASDNSDGPRFCSAIYPNEAGVLAAGTYRIQVTGYTSSQSFPYGLWVEVR